MGLARNTRPTRIRGWQVLAPAPAPVPSCPTQGPLPSRYVVMRLGYQGSILTSLSGGHSHTDQPLWYRERGTGGERAQAGCWRSGLASGGRCWGWREGAHKG